MSADHTLLRAVWGRAVGSSPLAVHLIDGLLARHREPHRRYHVVRHLASMVTDVQRLAAVEPVVDLDAIVVATCFHDAIYRPERHDNEAMSAELAARSLTELDDEAWPASRIDSVVQMIRATAHLADSAAPATRDTAVLLDADLAILGADTSTYATYVTGIRAEYSHLDADEWRTGRHGVLDALLARPQLYRTPSARTWWEARARANLTAELAALS